MTERAENVLLVVLDTVRAKSTFLEGLGTTPNLEQLSEEGARFDRAITPAPWTLPAHASMFTGMYPSEHGTTTTEDTLSQDVDTVAEELRGAGFETGLFTPNMFLTEFFGMDRGFEVAEYVEQSESKLFEDAFDPIQYVRERKSSDGYWSLIRELASGPIHKNLANAIYYQLPDVGEGPTQGEWDDRAVESATEFIEECAGEERFFATLNLVEAHAPWPYDPDVLAANGVIPAKIAPDARWENVAGQSADQWEFAAGEVDFEQTDREILGALYEAWIRRADSLIEDLMAQLERSDVRDETLVIITADHGERLGEDGVLGHTYSLHEEVTHVPLVCTGPTVSSGVVEEPVSLKNLYGTILRSTDVDTNPQSLFDEDAAGMAFTEMDGADPERIADLKGEQYRSVAEDFPRRSALYSPDGCAELNHETGQMQGEAQAISELKKLLDSLNKRRTTTDETADIPDDVGDRLEHLGYR